MAKIYAQLAKRQKNDGTLAVYLMTHINSKRIEINTGVSVLPNKWDEDKSKVKGNSKVAKDHNLIIENCRKRMSDIFVRYRLQNKPLTISLLKQNTKTHPSE